MTRIAVVDPEKCRINDCGKECIKYCPPMRTGTEVIIIEPDRKSIRIIEELCEGEGICVKKCPFHAIQIINLPSDFDADVTHRYSANGFKLHRLPSPRPGLVLGLVGQNGAGKSTSLRILAGEIRPNFGNWEAEPEWEEIITHYRGSELQTHFKKLAEGTLKVISKPQNISRISKVVKGTVASLLTKVAGDEAKARALAEKMGLLNTWNRSVDKLSGGELQKLAIGAALLREADMYLFDEPSSYLDVKERMRVASLIRELKEIGKTVVVVEHDLALLDYISDQVSLYYGEPGAYGVVTKPHNVREGINIFLDGYIPEENMRFRSEPLSFRKVQLEEEKGASHRVALTYGTMTKEYKSFKLQVEPGQIRKGEVIGILGPNGIGKTTFIKMLAGLIPPTTSDMELMIEGIGSSAVDQDLASSTAASPAETSSTLLSETEEKEADEPEGTITPTRLKVSYKPQYITTDSTMTVREFLTSVNRTLFTSAFLKSELIRPLRIDRIEDQELASLSGGELQKVAIAACLARKADIYLLDEPSAYISAEDRVAVSKVINRMIAHQGASAFVVEHDLMMLTYLSNRIITFSGEPGKQGHASGPLPVSIALNNFLKDMEITFREDPQTGRPRVNKPGSKLDKQQKREGKYYLSA